jgi:uncharacterized protein (TIGR02246 family)
MTDRGIETAMRALYAAMLAHDIAALDALLAEDCVYVHSTGVVEDKAAFLAGVRDGLYEYQHVVAVAERIATGPDIAVVFDTIDFRGGPRGGAHKPVRLITTLVWRHRADRWRLIHRHATRVP